MNTLRKLERALPTSTTSNVKATDESSSEGSVGKRSRGSSSVTSSNDTTSTSATSAVTTVDDDTSFNKSWEIPTTLGTTDITTAWGEECDDAAAETSTFPEQAEAAPVAPKSAKKKRYGDDLVWPCRATQLVPLMHLLYPGEPAFYDGEFVAYKLRDLRTGAVYFKQVLGRGAVVNSIGQTIYDVFPCYPNKGKFTEHYEILEKRYPPEKYLVELPDTWCENGAQPASEVEANLRMIFHGRPVVMHDHRGDTTAFLYETSNSMFHDNGATVVDTQQMYAGSIPGVGDPMQPGLAATCKFILGENPQDDGNHSPVKDADGTRKLWLVQNPDYDRAKELAKLHATGWTPMQYPRQVPFNERPENRGGRAGGRDGRHGGRGKGYNVASLQTTESNYRKPDAINARGTLITPTQRGSFSANGRGGMRGRAAHRRGNGRAAPSTFKLDQGDFPALGMK